MAINPGIWPIPAHHNGGKQVGSDVRIRQAVIDRLPVGLTVTVETIGEFRSILGLPKAQGFSNRGVCRAINSLHRGHGGAVVIARPHTTEYERLWVVRRPCDEYRALSIADTMVVIMVWAMESSLPRHAWSWCDLLMDTGLEDAWTALELATIVRYMQQQQRLHVTEYEDGHLGISLGTY